MSDDWCSALLLQIPVVFSEQNCCHCELFSSWFWFVFLRFWNSIVNYSRLVMFSFGFQDAVQRGLRREDVYFQRVGWGLFRLWSFLNLSHSASIRLAPLLIL